MRSLSTLQVSLGVSLAFHAALLTLGVATGAQEKPPFRDLGLDVILVNASSADAPDNPQALAQQTLRGGGEADQGHATSPRPPKEQTVDGDATDTRPSTVAELQQQQEQMLQQVQQQLADLQTQLQLPAGDPAIAARQQRSAQLLAEIERRVREENARPRRHFVGPSTREVVYARYYERARRRIEATGTEHFPQVNGQKLYGELTMAVTIDHAGRVVSTEVVESSGSKLLDNQACAIVRAAEPFGAFDKPMRQRTDQLVIVSRFKFDQTDTVQARVTSQ